MLICCKQHVYVDDKEHITPVGVANWRNTNTPFGIKAKDRSVHMYVIGKTGVGKSTLKEYLIRK